MNFTKTFFTWSVLGLFLGSLASCTQDKIEPSSTEESHSFNIEQLHSDYIARHGQEISIEYTSLEKLNEAFIENGLTPLTLESLSISQEEYELAQIRIQDGDVATLRCDDPVYQFLGDMNDNGILTTWDTVLARRVILQTDPPSFNSALFGLITDYHMSVEPELTTADIVKAIQVILGLPC